jgi:hypothetical protein
VVLVAADRKRHRDGGRDNLHATLGFAIVQEAAAI